MEEAREAQGRPGGPGDPRRRALAHRGDRRHEIQRPDPSHRRRLGYGPAIGLPGDLSTYEIDGNKLFASGSNGKKAYVGVWDLQTGQSDWGDAKGRRTRGSVPNLVVQGDRVLFVDSGGAYTGVAKADGQELFSVDLPWEAKESPTLLATRPDGTLVTWSSQNVIGLTPDGKVKFQAHYPPPPITGLQAVAGAALIAASAAAAAGSAASYSQSSTQSYSWGSVTTTTYNTQASQDLREASAAFAGAAAAVMTRARASKAADNSYFILTKVEDESGKGVGLVRVDLDTGEEIAQVKLGERDPDYAIDEVTGRLFLLRNEKILEGYAIGAPLVVSEAAGEEPSPDVATE